MITFKKNLEIFNKIANRYYFIKDNFSVNLLKASLKRFDIVNIQDNKDTVKIETNNLIIVVQLNDKKISSNIVMKGDQGEVIKYNLVSGNIIIGE